MLLLILSIVLILVSCGSKYSVVKNYIPSGNKECVEQCKIRLAGCKTKCLEDYRTCLKESVDRAKKIYEVLYEDYRNKLEDYHLQYREYLFTLEKFRVIESSLREDYEFFSRICKKYKDKEACKRRNYLKKHLRKIHFDRPLKPLKPVKPDYRQILVKERKACVCDCGCMQEYDVCFQSCGGRIETKRICVENCDR